MRAPKSHRKNLLAVFDQALKAIGPRDWWPGKTDFEVIVGAILTQNTNWRNVEKAIANLKKAKILTPRKIHDYPEDQLAQLIRPSGYFNMKAKKLKAFTEFLFTHYNGSLARLKKRPLLELREELLGVHGIGPETADSILLYALDHPSFVVDAYTRRIFARHGLFKEKVSYDEMRDYFMTHLEHDRALFNEFHALIVHIGHHYCRKTPHCEKCPWNWIEFKS